MVIAASVFGAAGVENGAGLSSLEVNVVCMIFHTFDFESQDQQITAYRKHRQCQFIKAMESFVSSSLARRLP
jgi:galactokinase